MAVGHLSLGRLKWFPCNKVPKIISHRLKNVNCDINEASEKEMLKMDGVGEVKAKAIINYRAAKRRGSHEKWRILNGISTVGLM